MGTTTLKQRRDRLASRMGYGRNQTLPTHVKTVLDECIQDALRDVYGRKRWNYLEAKSRVELEAADTDGLIGGTAGGTAITGTGTSFNTSMATNPRLRTDGEIYRVATVDSTTALTLTDALLRTVSAEAFVLYEDEIVLSSTLESIESMFVASPSKRVLPRGPAWMDDHKSRSAPTGHPAFFCSRGVDSNGYTMIELYPIPGYNEILHVRGYKAPTIPTADGGTDDVPQRFSNVVDMRARYYLYTSAKKDLQLASAAETQYERAILRMIAEENPNQGPGGFELDPAFFGRERLDVGANNLSTD